MAGARALRKATAERIATRLVTSAGASAEVSGDTIVVRDPRGAIVVTYDAATGRTELTAPGDLVLAAPEGKVLLKGREIELDADVRATVRSPEVVNAAGRWELVAERVIERAEDVYREVGSLLQVRAGRMRTIVRDTYQLFGKRVAVRAEEDTSIDGKRVLLG
jgi:hypothetical protein